MRRRLLAAFAIAATLGAGGEALDLTCPPGAQLRERGRDFACETPDGVGEGPFWSRRDDGSLRIWGTARAGLTDGLWLELHPSGARKIEATYRRGVLVGPFRTFDAEGRPVHGGAHDESGEMHGTWTRWWPNGRERMRWEMRRGVADGEVAAFFEGGGKRFEGRRENGRRSGRWTWWDARGDVVARCRFEDDAVVEGACGSFAAE